MDDSAERPTAIDLSQEDPLPPPQFWAEICLNDGDDLQDALARIQNVVVPQIGSTCSCILIVLQRRPSVSYKKRMDRLDAELNLMG